MPKYSSFSVFILCQFSDDYTFFSFTGSHNSAVMTVS